MSRCRTSRAPDPSVESIHTRRARFIAQLDLASSYFMQAHCTENWELAQRSLGGARAIARLLEEELSKPGVAAFLDQQSQLRLSDLNAALDRANVLIDEDAEAELQRAPTTGSSMYDAFSAE